MANYVPAEAADILRFITFVRPQPNGCWLWAGGHNKAGYAKFWFDGKTKLAMHFALRIAGRECPNGSEPDHLCRIPGCINPEHLDNVTRRVNLIRGNSPVGLNARKLHCTHGHLFDEANTRIDPKTGSRCCRTCATETQKRLYNNNPQKYRDRQKGYRSAKVRASTGTA